ncbi:hypothetical protein GT755_00385 [Herbidospora sp. NEAU-GS84]|uniref:Poly A polymerase head domain-containing protein n=1 Tax=Herbidospora solisilvae TaxID=2696284 RepID=A0A7C9NB68_9ACTN|nr:hypothetical protein [Herbidospora solisilvae]NAS20135.1 hypothetical protein [Herbidospora solisilvae]
MTQKSGDGNISPVRPLLVGDVIAERRVAGFGWLMQNGDVASTHLDDRLLVDGDEHLPGPPNRPVPQTADGAHSLAAMPPADLPAHRVHAAESLNPATPVRAGALLDLRGAPWRPLIRPLLAAVHATGHRLWLAGGAARDLVADVPLSEVNDLDLSGTVPAGRFTDITRQTLRALGMSECQVTVNPSSLVCSVLPPKRKTRLIEYRGLSKGGFKFPAVGSRLSEDAQYRDFAFNALLYDALDHQIMDPSGTGLDDLLGKERRFTPLNVSDDPLTQAMVIVRAAKFALRWREDDPSGVVTFDLEPLKARIAALPPMLGRMLSSSEWRGLRNAYRRSVRATTQQQREFAAMLPQPGRDLLNTLIGDAR